MGSVLHTLLTVNHIPFRNDDNSLFTVNMTQYRNGAGDEENIYIKTIEFDKWGITGVNYNFTKQNISDFIDQDFYWPHSYDLELQGDGLADDF